MGHSRDEMVTSSEQPGRRRAVLEIVLRLVLVALVGLSVYQLLAAGTYRIALGSATIRLAPTLEGGDTVLPLGPAGSVSFDTHDTPVDLTVDFVFDADAQIADETQALSARPAGRGADRHGRAALLRDRQDAVAGRLGLSGGLLVAGVGRLRWRRLLIGAGAGLVLVTGTTGAIA